MLCSYLIVLDHRTEFARLHHVEGVGKGLLLVDEHAGTHLDCSTRCAECLDLLHREVSQEDAASHGLIPDDVRILGGDGSDADGGGAAAGSHAETAAIARCGRTKVSAEAQISSRCLVHTNQTTSRRKKNRQACSRRP